MGHDLNCVKRPAGYRGRLLAECLPQKRSGDIGFPLEPAIAAMKLVTMT